MDSRFKEIDSFLKYYAEILKQNPGRDYGPSFWYAQLSGYRYTNEEYNTDIRDCWNDLINYFRIDPNRPANQNLNVYNDSRQTRFLQFASDQESPAKEFYKMYISFDKEHIGPAAKLIFDFVRKNGMESHSKLSDTLRCDSIVMRIVGEENIVKLLNFINNNDYLVRNARLTNPFMLRIGKVGIAYDAHLSFNETLAEVLYNYFYIKVNSRSLDSVSYEDFASYAKNYEKAMYSSSEAIEYISNLKSFKVCEQRWSMSKADVHDNYKKILDLIGKSVQKDFNLNDFMANVYNYMNNRFEDNIQSFSSPTVRLDQTETQVYYNYKEEQMLLDEYINYALSKYSNVNVIADALNQYANGKTTTITRDKDFRLRFTNCITPSHIPDLTANDTYSYVLRIRDNKINMIFQGLYQTYQRYGAEQLRGAAQRATEGNYSSITNGDGNYRDFIKENVTPGEFLDALIIISNTYSPERYGEEFQNAIMSAIGRKR